MREINFTGDSLIHVAASEANLHLVKSPPAGRKNPVLLHKKIHNVNFFVQKNNMSHAAAGKADVWVGHQTNISCTAELLSVTQIIWSDPNYVVGVQPDI